MLPPKFENKERYIYGTFKLAIAAALNNRNEVMKVETFFFGSNKKNVQPSDPINKNIFSFDIATNLWHFYAYLSDCRNIHLYITDSQNEIYTCEVPLVLMPSSSVLNKFNKNIDYLFANNSYLLETKQKIRVFDDKRRVLGLVDVQMDLKFDEQINRLLHGAGVVNMEDLLIIDQISPIPSAIQLDNFEQLKEQQSQFQTRMAPQKNPMQFDKQKQQKEVYLSKNEGKARQYIPKLDQQFLQVQQDKPSQQDQKMIEDDIDRLIAQMQSRPYDSTRYLQNQAETHKKENFNFANTVPLLPQSKSNYQQSKPPKCPSSTKATRNGLSPIKNPPIHSYSVTNPPQSDRVNYLMNKTTLTNREFKRSAEKNLGMSNSRQKIEMSTPKGTIRLKIHQLMMQRYEQDVSLILKCYLNDDSDEYYTVNGVKQGETISFSSNMLINQKREISLLRFVLIDSFDMKSIYAHGQFEMERLLSMKPTKGVFTVNMRSAGSSQRTGSKSKVVTIDQCRLVRVVPNMKTLRIELQYEQQIEIVQIYLNLSNFTKTIKTCRYKIPMTKQTIEFKITELQNSKHVNIFPHNRSSQGRAQDKIIVELWSAEELIGINEVSLKQLQNTNQRIIMSSLQPIYLYEQTRNVQSIKGGKTDNSFYLQLFYGTISQVQSLLNQAHRKQSRQQSNKQQVEVQQVLGVYVKQRKQQRQVQIQVNEHEVIKRVDAGEKHISKKTSLGLQQQQDQPQQQQEQHNQMEQIQNEFLNQSLQQKYLNQQTIPTYKPIQTSSHQEYNFKKTQLITTSQLKTRPILKSLTEQYQQLIKQCMSHFSNEESLRHLKTMVKDHLLYNFIQADSLRLILQELGIHRNTANTLLQDIVGHSNGMLNINVLYDMIYGLLLDGCVKQKYLDDAQVGKYCLTQLYANLQNRGKGEQLQVLFDQSVYYDQAKKMYEQVGYRLTMRQFSQIEIYSKKMKDGFKTDQKWIRNSLLSKSSAVEKQHRKKEEYKQQVIQKIYQHAQWDEDDDFFISNINLPHQQTIFITNNQSEATKSQRNGQQSKTAVVYKIEQATNNNSAVNQKPAIQTQISIKQPQTTPSIQNSNGQPMKMSIEGFQNCIETTECHLNITLSDPKLKIIYKTNQHQNFILLNRQQTSCELLMPSHEQYLDGSVQLLNNNKTIARCNFSMIADVRSVYTLKSVEQYQFCGLLYLRFRSI